ncbi:hypothetical protein LV564_05080 [Komagataeibacter nataicola]|uniref:hypothetical protein n=1 Tax=Komagataeibacter nataicola TaxID=265960 RepID=UPI0023DD5891|nr:hypothetical protein [Komagataeibacter nataicola]WEQ56461.1 hypothetical protein LV564_05080 [Komagataeibacter nataicola]
MTCLPTVADFDAGAVPAWTLIRTMPAEARGVAHSLFDTLKANRMVVMRSGTHMLSDDEIAAFICETPATLARTLPLIEQWGFAARDDEGALYSPHLLQREIRRQERARKRAEREENLRRFEAAQAAGIIPADDTLRGHHAKINGGKGGRPRKTENAEQARIRRAQEAEAATRQRNIPLMVSLPAPAEAKNRNLNQNRFSVSGGSVSVLGSEVSLDIDKDKEINSSISESAETGFAQVEAVIDDATLDRAVRTVMEAACFPKDSTRRHTGIVRKWLQAGIPEPVIVQAVADHTAAMHQNREIPQHAGCFDKPVRAAWAQHQISADLPEPAPSPVMQDWEKQARADLMEDHRAWSALMQELGDYGRAKQQWADMAAKRGRPTTELTLEAYLAAYRPQDVAA